MIKVIETTDLYNGIGRTTSKTIKIFGVTIYTKVLSSDALHLQKIQAIREKHYQENGR